MESNKSAENVPLDDCSSCSDVMQEPFQVKVEVDDANDWNDDPDNSQLAQERLEMSVDSVTNDMTESISLPADVTEDSCRPEFIEIVPLTTDTTQCDSGHWSDDVKPQHLSVVKQEPVHTPSEQSQAAVYQRENREEQRLYACPVCGKEFTNKKNLAAHSRRHTAETSFTCSKCGIIFSSKSTLRNHMNVHSGKYKCAECGKCFGYNKALARHMAIHTGEKPFECTVCGRPFITSWDLVKHSRIHSGERPYQCYICDKTFRVSGDLINHMRVHTGDKPYPCSLCNKRFNRSSNLNTHKRRVHSNRVPYCCPYCLKIFERHSSLKCHVRTHTGTKPYLCNHCSDRFEWVDQLRKHLLELHNEGTWFICHICQQKFTRRGNLTQHVRRHEGVMPYVCSECPKRFCTADEFIQHQLVHSDFRYFACGLCAKGFKHRHAVLMHFPICPHNQDYIAM